MLPTKPLLCVLLMLLAALHSTGGQAPAVNTEEEQPAAPAIASEATPDRYRDAVAGFSLRLAGGFRFLARQDSLVLFGSNDTPGVVFVETGETFTEAELAEATRAGYQDEGVMLLPDGAAVRLNLTLGVGVA
ncbi:MAG: hypothetical protein KIT83_18380, partial [Bryobacterales bacterium]|nr:hypothetical protein [Bryobacterales bacterium]